MTDKITLTNLVNLTNQTTAVNAINSNNAVITTAFDNTLSRDGTAPNQMGAVLDMNGNNIINLPAPATSASPVRLQDVSGNTVIGSIPIGGTTNQVLSKHSNANFDTQWSSLGTVGSVGLAMPADFTITNSPVTTTGTLTAAYATPPTGSGAFVQATSPTLVTPTLGAASATSINGQAITSGSGTLTLGSNTLTANNTGNVVTSATSAGGSLTGTYPNPTINSNTVTNAMIVNAAANTLKGNPTASTASVQDFTIGGLTQKASPAGTDLVLIQDQAASGALKYSPISSIATAGSVGSVNALTGAITIGSSGGSTITSSGTSITIGEPGGMVNKFRNGTFDIWQRGVGPLTVTTAGAYTADGWQVVPTGASVAVQQSAGRVVLAVNSLKITGATSVTDVVFKQRIESFMAAPLSSQNVTVQMQVFNATGGSITPLLTVKHPTASDNYAATTTDLAAASMTACVNNNWTLCTYTFAASASSYLGLEISVDFGNNFSTSGKSVQITEADIRATPNLSIGVNTVIAPPEMHPFATEMNICQRYFVSSYVNGTAPASIGSGFVGMGVQFGTGAAHTFFSISISPPVQMRTGTPTYTIYDNTGTSGKITSYNGTTWTNGSTALVNQNYATFAEVGVNNVSGTCGLSFMYQASSEL